MGNQVIRGTMGGHKKAITVSSTGNDVTTKKGMSRSASGADIEHTSHTQFEPIDKLAKILTERSQQEESVNGVTENVFKRYMFPQYPKLAEKLFLFLHRQSKATTSHLGTSAFRQQIERFLSIMNDQTILENYVKMYAREGIDVVPDGLDDLLMVTYQLALDSSSGGPQRCPHIHRTIESVTKSCFHGKEVLSVSYVSNWLWQNCPRLFNGLHRYIVHAFTTAYRNGAALLSEVQSRPQLAPATPVLEQSAPLDGSKPLLPLSHVWLLSGSLPLCYTQAEISPTEGTQALIAKMAGPTYPSHWTLLYNSGQHGSGANRFIHHVLGYKGPTLLFLRGVSPEEGGDRPTYCICSAVEWRESHLYWGDEDSMVIELSPTFRIVERGPKLVYLNTMIRGYPQGVRAGSDPRNPCVDLDKSFQCLKLNGVPYRLDSLEAWGCGDRKSRELQLEIKKWQVKEAEKQRVVKLSTTDWLDHPDRYLLELGGRTSYNNADNR
ncbi:uncharacterized protein LOC124300906 [Neodiprion virginianus]|uniref:uncharacterized protein LOC124178767 n=1 Tax=Neodiprion fabricii TaxID=2872261 RepID=UPI001ED9253E|nr:uncharacterized protein LOC124178767 [Neodiprion fabricii]XP_046611353.1 uncharacterized protein LOC124300906 [Neodiprion virginianus]